MLSLGLEGGTRNRRLLKCGLDAEETSRWRRHGDGSGATALQPWGKAQTEREPGAPAGGVRSLACLTAFNSL